MGLMRIRGRSGAVAVALAGLAMSGSVAASEWKLETGESTERAFARASAGPLDHGATWLREQPAWKLTGGEVTVSERLAGLDTGEDGPGDERGFDTASDADADDPDSFWRGWTGSIEGGINGSEGNSETLNLRMGVGAERKTEKMETKLKSEYAYATNNGEKEKNRWFTEARQDWYFGGDDRWGFFTIGRLEYDDFQDWDWRVSVFAGPSYKIVKTEKTTLNLRAGVGLSREFGGERNEVMPEGLLGGDFEHQLTERQKLTATVEYYPSFSHFPEYRLLARAGWEILIDPQVNMTLKLGVEDRYDSNPGEDIHKNDLDYFAMIAWKF